VCTAWHNLSFAVMSFLEAAAERPLLCM
jgi:hypothetical protein